MSGREHGLIFPAKRLEFADINERIAVVVKHSALIFMQKRSPHFLPRKMARPSPGLLYDDYVSGSMRISDIFYFLCNFQFLNKHKKKTFMKSSMASETIHEKGWASPSVPCSFVALLFLRSKPGAEPETSHHQTDTTGIVKSSFSICI